MKIYVAVILSLFTITCFAQEKNASLNKWSIGISFSPDYSYRLLKSDGGDNEEFMANRRDATESAKFGFTTGLEGYIAFL